MQHFQNISLYYIVWKRTLIWQNQAKQSHDPKLESTLWELSAQVCKILRCQTEYFRNFVLESKDTKHGSTSPNSAPNWLIIALRITGSKWHLVCSYGKIAEVMFSVHLFKKKKNMQRWKSERCTFFNTLLSAHIWLDEGTEGRPGVSSCNRTIHGPVGLSSAGRSCLGISSSYLWVHTIR